MQGLSIPDHPSSPNDLSEINEGTMEIAIKKSKDCSNIKLNTDTIKEIKTIFSFHFITLNDSLKGLDNLEPKDAIPTTDIPTKIIKEHKNLISYYICPIS